MKIPKLYTYVCFLALLPFQLFSQECKDSIVTFVHKDPLLTGINPSGFLSLQNGSVAYISYRQTPNGRTQNITLSDANGHFLAAREIRDNVDDFNLSVDNLIEVPNQKLIAIGKSLSQEGYSKGLILICLDYNLNILWSKLIRRSLDVGLNTNYYQWGVGADALGNIYLSSYVTQTGSPQPVGIIFASLGSQGEIRWSKGLPYDSFTQNLALDGVTTIGNKVFFLGSIQIANQVGCIAISLNTATGEFIKSSIGILEDQPSSINIGSTHQQNFILRPREADFYYGISRKINNTPQTSFAVFLIDTNLNTSSSLLIKGNLLAPPWHFDISKQGNISFAGIYSSLPGSDVRNIAVIDSMGKLLLGKQLTPGIFNRPNIYTSKFSSDGNYILLPHSNFINDSLSLMKTPLFADSALYSCLVKDTIFFHSEKIAVNSDIYNLGEFADGVAVVEPLLIVGEEYTFYKEEICKKVSVCNQIEIIGETEACTNTQLRLLARKNETCLKPIHWDLENLPAEITSISDSSVSLVFSSAWSGRVIASLEGCGITDTIEIVVSAPIESLHLGNDTILCPGQTIQLNAGINASSYLWNTGNTQASIWISTPGLYSVKVSDFCGQEISDSIMVRESDQPFEGIEDSNICLTDSKFIERKEIYQYNWDPQPHLSNSIGYVFKPTSTTEYEVIVTDAYGCEWKDSFVIRIEDCPKTIFFPNAFSPNQDGLNDEFGAIVQAPLEKFELKVFNRWGEIVFIGNLPSSRWNGLIKGAHAPVGTYVWVCKYKFYNIPEQLQKGLVVLIK